LNNNGSDEKELTQGEGAEQKASKPETEHTAPKAAHDRGGRGGRTGGSSFRGNREGGNREGAPRRGRGDERDGDFRREQSEFEETVVRVNRCAAVVKGGRRFSFSALVVVGDGNGRVGLGHGKAREVPSAISKAIQNAKKDLFKIEVIKETIPHEVVGHFGSAWVKMLPAAPGTGVIAGPSVRAVVERVGISNILTKSFGNCNALNLAKAAMDGLKQLRSRATV
jgi:small subunit ribosomal protein S5